MTLLFILLLNSSIILGNTQRLVSLEELLTKDPAIELFKVFEKKELILNSFSKDLSIKLAPVNLIFKESFVAKIPQGSVYSKDGFIIFQDQIISDFIFPLKSLKSKAAQFFSKNENIESAYFFPGRVAVISVSCKTNSTACYFHWISAVLSRLATLETSGIEYDFLYVSSHQPFMKETLMACGISPDKVIDPQDYPYIVSDELIVPSLAHGDAQMGSIKTSYCAPWHINFLRAKMLPIVQNNHLFSKKVFISRSDAQIRQTSNEDDIFKLLSLYGFERYQLSKLTFLQQVELFNNAEIVIATHGAGLVNTIFSKPGTKIIELFQKKIKATYWFLSQILNLDHQCIFTHEFNHDQVMNREIPLEIIEKIIKDLELEL
ncbi:MAG: glycosyltransferase family 61 protein [Candidatus Dependentiae bacterium]|nr:glycosyltransferase family 61 protein [Candidatus Dependentiae bacterium]